MSRPCQCGKCQICYLYDNNPEYRAHFDGAKLPDNRPVVNDQVGYRPCQHLGRRQRDPDTNAVVQRWCTTG